MSDIENKIKELSEKVETLQYRQYGINNELQTLHNELHELKTLFHKDQPSSISDKPVVPQPPKLVYQKKIERSLPKSVKSPDKIISNQKLEDFIGTNLISKVGILITIIGVFIGAKYAIDKELISPAMRIVSGYSAGFVLIFIALRLKNKYENFSAVLMGGGLAVCYFITYIAYGFYQLFPQALSFLLMIVITAAAVGIALWYNQKVIAVLGQIAAYAIPFLLSNGSGKVLVLFSYISIINIGLLILSFKRDWKILYRIAFFLTWIIYAVWLAFKKQQLEQESIGLIFLFINFFTFYFTFLSYKILKKELYNFLEVGILLLNALIFFFFGQVLINDLFTNHHVFTWFTIINAAIHFSVGYFIYRLKLADKSVYQFITGLGILFITIAIPVELNGSWVTLLWAVEATTLCWVAVKNQRRLYLFMALPMIIIAAISLLQDWSDSYTFYNNYSVDTTPRTAFWNTIFCFSFLTSACFGYITFMFLKSKLKLNSSLLFFFKRLLPVLFFAALYFTFFNEISFAWSNILTNDFIRSENINYFKCVSLLMYSFLYVSIFLAVNCRYKKSKVAAAFLVFAGIGCLAFFLLLGLNILGDLRENYITMKSATLHPSLWLLSVRYVCFLALAILILNCRNTVRNIFNSESSTKIFALLFNLTLLSIICSEFVNWAHLAGYKNQYKLGLSIICGLNALVLIFVGITTKRKYLRIAAMSLFGVTLLKLFFYDIAALSTISKTIVLVVLGILLLVISFLYNKYKTIIFGEDE